LTHKPLTHRGAFDDDFRENFNDKMHGVAPSWVKRRRLYLSEILSALLLPASHKASHKTFHRTFHENNHQLHLRIISRKRVTRRAPVRRPCDARIIWSGK
jgi:hypothetical protein